VLRLLGKDEALSRIASAIQSIERDVARGAGR
jgi:hypothetical protein